MPLYKLRKPSCFTTLRATVIIPLPALVVPVCIRVLTVSRGKPITVPTMPALSPPRASSPKWRSRHDFLVIPQKAKGGFCTNTTTPLMQRERSVELLCYHTIRYFVSPWHHSRTNGLGSVSFRFRASTGRAVCELCDACQCGQSIGSFEGDQVHSQYAHMNTLVPTARASTCTLGEGRETVSYMT